MGKEPQRHEWPEAQKRCRLSDQDVVMAKSLGFGPDALIRAIPDRKQGWKLPAKDWIRELHFERFGEVLGEKPIVVAPMTEEEEEAARLFEEELYWEDYWDRNEPSEPER